MSIDSFYEVMFFNIAEFLTEYEKLPCLWDKMHKDFKDRKVRLNAEERLGEKLGIFNLQALRKKIRSVRGTYNTEIRKIKQSLDSGSELYMPKLSWFPWADKFLRVTTDLPLDVEVSTRNASTISKENLKRRLRSKNGVTVVMVRAPADDNEELTSADAYDHEDENGELEEEVYEEEVLELDENETEDEILQNIKQDVSDDSNIETFEDQHTSEEQNLPDYKPRVKKRKLSKNCDCESLVDTVKSLKDMCRATENEFAVFGRSVGVQLQNMPIELALQIQTDIQAHITMSRLDYLRKRKCRDEEL